MNSNLVFLYLSPMGDSAARSFKESASDSLRRMLAAYQGLKH